MKTKYTIKLLTPIIKNSLSWAQVLRALNLKQTGGNHSNIRKWATYYKIDHSHFTGSLWSKGYTKDTHPSIKKQVLSSKIPDKDVFKRNAHPLINAKLTKRLVEDYNWEYKCSSCGVDEWLNKPIVLDLDHINGDNSDCRFENLRFLCPNCHRQTPTWGIKKH